MKSVLLAAALSPLLLGSLLGQSFPLPPVPTALRQEIVVTASGFPESLESAPAAVTLIDRAQIDERKARDIADVLREVPGLTISRSGSAGKATSLFTRGSNSTHTLVLWNGIEMNNPYFSGYDWGRFSTAGIERIEIVRGPYSALYGSDAVAGVVNIFTRPVTPYLRGGIEAGGKGLLNLNAEGGWSFGALNTGGAIEHRQDDGWSRNDDFKQDAANANIGWSFSNGSLGLTARATAYELGIPLNLNADATALTPSLGRRQEGTELQVALPFELNLGRFHYEITLSQSDRDDDFSDPDDPFGLVFTSTESSTRRAHVSARAHSSIGVVIAGAEIEKAEVTDETNFGLNLEERRRESRSLFLEDRLTRSIGTSRLELSVGLRHDHFDTFGSELSPRAGLALIQGPNKFRLAYGEAFRAPSVGELYFPFFGNDALDTEKSKSWEVGFDRRSHSRDLSVTYFRNDFDNLIIFDNAISKFGNAGAARTSGIEIGGTLQLGPQWNTSAAYTYLDTERAESGDSLLRRPRHSGSLSVGYDSRRWSAQATVVHGGERDDLLPVFPFNRISAGAFTTVDANVGMDLGSWSPYARVENLTGEEYEEVAGYRAPGRRLSMGVRWILGGAPAIQ